MSAQKVLIISYFYPPCGLTASQRVQSWSDYFHLAGLHPIVVTRNWDRPVKEETDALYSSGDKEIYQQTETSEVYYLPFKNSVRDRIFIRKKTGSGRLLSKLLTLKQLVLQNFFLNEISFRNLYDKASELIGADPNITKVLISGGPFAQFRFGYLLKKKYPHIKWFADYRDDWSTNEINIRNTFLHKAIFKFESRFEKKWLANCSAVLSVSPWYTDKIAAFTGRPGFTIYNGFDEMYDLPAPAHSDPNKVVLLYNGTLYASQPIEKFITVLSQVEKEFPQLKISLQFPGLAFDPIQSERVKRMAVGLNFEVVILPRIPKQEVINMQHNADVLLMFAHAGKKGVTSSKIFEYMAIRKPVILFPSDHDVVEALVKETGVGLIADNEEELKEVLRKLFQNKMQKEGALTTGDLSRIVNYSRKNQALHLANIILNA